MPAGQVVNVVVCSAQVPSGGAFVAGGLLAYGACPTGQTAYIVPSYVPFSDSGSYIDGLMRPFDTSAASGIFSFGFGVVVAFYLIGLKGSVLIKPFWSGWGR
jgi:hypothetical protein